MTGYGRGEASRGGVKAVVEFSSVNRRQLDVHIVLPRSLQVLEPRIHEEIHKKISRGRLTGEVSIARSARARQEAVHIDHDLARAYVKALRKTAKDLGLNSNLDANLLLTLPDVVQYEQVSEDPEKIWPILDQALKKALSGLLGMRKSEGATLQKDLLQRLGLLRKYCAQVNRRAPSVVKSYKQALHTRLKRAGLKIDVSDERVLKELAIFADKSDITEELTRLDSHAGQMKSLMQAKEATGKSMDFLAQEMFREINTIGSKANDATILRHVVSFKAELERLREQVQNIE